MFGVRRASDTVAGEAGPWGLAEQLGMLRAGDLVTYCYSPRSQATGIVLPSGVGVEPAVSDARERGVLFDTADGGAMDFSIATAAIAAGFPPDTISSDYHSHELAHRLDGDTGALALALSAKTRHSPDLPSASVCLPPL